LRTGEMSVPGSRKRNVLGVLVDAVARDSAVAAIIDAARERQRLTVSALAVHGVMTGVLDREHRYRLNHLDLVVPDGQPVRWALNLLHAARLPERVYGPDLMLDVCAKAAERGLPVYFYGSRSETLESLCRNLTARYPGLVIAGAQGSRFRRLSPPERVATVEAIRRSGAAIVFIGLGCPRQEVWAYEYGRELNIPLIAVGAAFDFHAGNLKRAPASLQRAGLEWLYRLLQEPRRLWRRYLFLNPSYLALLVVQALRLHAFDGGSATQPTHDVSYG
jgi:N-acetylglucosaminyldiphosphoundecaprenol N-acetyl-beta-D-mannosaminyltransferase